MKKILFSCTLIIFFLQPVCCEQYKHISCVMHVHSLYSDNGKLTIEQITEIAARKKIRAIIFADHDIMKYDYGIWPFYKVINKQMEFDSVLKIGPGKYFKEISAVQQKFPGVLLIPGIESSPYYYWSGSAVKKNLILHEWHKHLILAGMDKPGQYKNLPVLGNEDNAGSLNFFMLFLLLICLFAGIWLLSFNKAAGAVILGITLFAAIKYFPFKSLPYNQYHGEQREKPYQAVINYMNKTVPDTGLIFWAHPESPNYDKIFHTGIVSLQTKKYAESLLNTEGYTGFAYFQEGNRAVGRQGGIWDKVLTEYCNGERKSPVWAAGELDYRKEGFLGTYIDTVQNILLMQKDEPVTMETVSRCIKSGNFYVIKKPHSAKFIPLINEYSAINGNFVLNITADDKRSHLIKIKLINQNKVLNIYEKYVPVTLKVPLLRINSPHRLNYYRIEAVIDGNYELVTNPVFF